MESTAVRRLGVVLALVAVATAACSGGTSWVVGPTFVPGASPSAGASAAPSVQASPSAAPSPSPATAPSATPSREPIAGGWSLVKTAPCPDSDFECVTLAVPRDHFVEGGPTWEVTFGILRASGDRKGVFVNVAGGPGESGLSVADAYTAAFPAGITDAYDVVWFDQRGVGASQPLQCPEATGAYYEDDAQAADPAQADAVKAAARTYVEACVDETGVDEADLAYYSTRQAVEDLEAFRDYLDVSKIQLYGYSYGTQYVQTYAAAHPDRIAALYVDGPVDLTLEGPTSWAEAGRSFDDVLLATLTGCTTDRACRTDAEADTALEAYDALADRLAGGPIDIDFVTADGGTEPRTLTLADLQNVAASYLYSTLDRMMLLRILASAADGDYIPFARAAAISLGLDPETLAVVDDPTWSDAMYYAVQCADYDYFPDATDADARADAFLDYAAAAGVDRLRLGAVYYGDLPCMYWPGLPSHASRPEPIVDPPYPTFVLVGSADPITPVANAYRIASRLDEAYLIITDGGPHVTFGWGEACPDEILGRYLVDGTVPRSAITTCDGVVADDYVAVGRDQPDRYADALSLMTSMDDQISYTNDYQFQLADVPLAVGCDFGGSITYTPTDTGTDLTLERCAFVDGLPMTGSGAFDDETGGLDLEVRVAGGDLTYARDGEGGVSVSGRFRGEAVDQSG